MVGIDEIGEKRLKIAVLHAFFVPKGGGEKLIFDIRNYYHADLFTGAIDRKIWDREKQDQDSFNKELYNPNYKFTWLHDDVKIPYVRKIVRQLQLKFSPKLNVLNEYDAVIFSGNIAGVTGRITNKNTKKIIYCHTPPRPFTDQFESKLAKFPFIFRPIAKLFRDWVITEYRNELKKADSVVTNAYNTQNRLKRYVGLDSVVIQPAVNTARFKYLSTGDYYISYARLEDLKRIRIIIEAFKKMPNKKLIVCSSGPLKDWLISEISKYPNITYNGLVTDAKLDELVGNCIAVVYIPVEEDFGIIQCEAMAAGKPVIGVKEGGLLETVIDNKTGILIKSNPEVKDLILAVEEMTPGKAKSMKSDCIDQAKNFDSSVFFRKFDKLINQLRSDK
jgi:glycosyltransferase involved in cell wall biosynthesis